MQARDIGGIWKRDNDISRARSSLFAPRNLRRLSRRTQKIKHELFGNYVSALYYFTPDGELGLVHTIFEATKTLANTSPTPFHYLTQT